MQEGNGSVWCIWSARLYSLKLANLPLTAPSVLLQNTWHGRSDFKPKHQWWYRHQLLPLSFTKGAISLPELPLTT